MSFKAFEDETIQSYVNEKIETVSLSETSPSASYAHFFTGIRSLGKIGSLNGEDDPDFGFNKEDEIKYKFDFTEIPILGQSITADMVNGVYMSEGDMNYGTAAGYNTTTSHQRVFDHIAYYLYRADLDDNYDPSVTNIQSGSTSVDISVFKLINLRKDIGFSGIKPSSFRMELNLGTQSITGHIDGSSAEPLYYDTHATGFTGALDLKNPYGGEVGLSDKSFFGVSLNDTPYMAAEGIDNIVDGITIEAIIRPHQKDSVLFFRRIANSADDKTRNKFMKLELTKGPNGINDAFRFYIRNTSTYPNNSDVYADKTESNFTENFSDANVQASGLFVPNDVGINLFDGNFHHIIVTWSPYELVSNNIGDAELGSGVVLGYVDGYKLLNKEQVFPRLKGSDSSNGPTPQPNMLEQRIPIRQERLRSTDSLDGPSGNNIYIGISNFSRSDGEFDGDRGVLAPSNDPKISGPYDGQIQELRVWNIRLKDGTTKYNDNLNTLLSTTVDVVANPEKSIIGTFNNFYDAGLTGTSTSAGNIVGWWRFNAIGSLTAADHAGGLTPGLIADGPALAADPTGQLSGSSGVLVGNSTMRLYNSKNILLGSSGNVFNEESVSSLQRTLTYYDQPAAGLKPVNNNLNQGRILRRTISDEAKRVGVIFYDTNQIVLDNDDEFVNMNFTWPTSGVSGDFGFSVTSDNVDNNSINVERLKYDAVIRSGRTLFSAVAEGSEFNYTENPTGKNPDTNENIFDDPTAFITSVGLYNNEGELLAVGKLSNTVKKNNKIQIEAQVKLDY